MKVKISVTLSHSLLAEVDRRAARGANRSQFIENAVRRHIAALAGRRHNRHDLAIINRRAARLNREARDVLDYHIPL